jgi:hypothetical protein
MDQWQKDVPTASANQRDVSRALQSPNDVRFGLCFNTAPLFENLRNNGNVRSATL